MPRIARSIELLYQTRGDPVSWPIAFSDPATGQPLDPNGATVTAVLVWPGASRPLVVAPLDASCAALITGSAALTTDLPVGRVNELQVAFADSLGMVFRFVWGVIGERP